MGHRHQGQRRRNYGRRQHELRERRPDSAGRGEWPVNENTLEWGLINLDAEDRHLDGRLGGQTR